MKGAEDQHWLPEKHELILLPLLFRLFPYSRFDYNVPHLFYCTFDKSTFSIFNLNPAHCKLLSNCLNAPGHSPLWVFAPFVPSKLAPPHLWKIVRTIFAPYANLFGTNMPCMLPFNGWHLTLSATSSSAPGCYYAAPRRVSPTRQTSLL